MSANNAHERVQKECKRVQFIINEKTGGGVILEKVGEDLNQEISIKQESQPYTDYEPVQDANLARRRAALPDFDRVSEVVGEVASGVASLAVPIVLACLYGFGCLVVFVVKLAGAILYGIARACISGLSSPPRANRKSQDYDWSSKPTQGKSQGRSGNTYIFNNYINEGK